MARALHELLLEETSRVAFRRPYATMIIVQVGTTGNRFCRAHSYGSQDDLSQDMRTSSYTVRALANAALLLKVPVQYQFPVLACGMAVQTLAKHYLRSTRGMEAYLLLRTTNP